ncbi:hypothetical protein BCY89_26965 [Sphingobacterium siyangense]|uniref:Uncharacterized protein n=1 Tax=Sphingobacterium siyangense TaxID=459529 RepID=A0A420G0J4_9SPHI|nr:hypothetical protein BV902_17495 [Sphingobacterium sp. B29]RKF38707.1 hypothetical protein BCY89_26965 [Sphingobacterium siyangense]
MITVPIRYFKRKMRYFLEYRTLGFCYMLFNYFANMPAALSFAFKSRNSLKIPCTSVRYWFGSRIGYGKP